MMAMFPLLVAALVGLWLWLEKRDREAWVSHPDRPWNVHTRAVEADIARQRQKYDEAFAENTRKRIEGMRRLAKALDTPEGT